MLAKELFNLLTVNNIEFNGDVDLLDDGMLLWSLKFEPIKVLEDEKKLIPEEELLEALEEDLDYIRELFEEYDADWYENFDTAFEFNLEGDTLSIELFAKDAFEDDDLEDEDIEFDEDEENEEE